jgi:hypothetical protein
VGPDRVTIYILSLSGFLAVLALMAWQLRSVPTPAPRPVVVVRRIYQTRVVETLVGAAKGAGAVTQSVSSSGSAVPVASAPTTRAS